MALAAGGQGVLTVEGKRMHEVRRRPAVVVMAAAALRRVEVLLHERMQRRRGQLVVNSVTRNTILGGDLSVHRVEIRRIFAAKCPRGAREA